MQGLLAKKVPQGLKRRAFFGIKSTKHQPRMAHLLLFKRIFGVPDPLVIPGLLRVVFCDDESVPHRFRADSLTALSRSRQGGVGVETQCNTVRIFC